MASGLLTQTRCAGQTPQKKLGQTGPDTGETLPRGQLLELPLHSRKNTKTDPEVCARGVRLFPHESPLLGNFGPAHSSSNRAPFVPQKKSPGETAKERNRDAFRCCKATGSEPLRPASERRGLGAGGPA